MVPEAVCAELRALVGEDWFLDSPEDLATYSYDAFLPDAMPDGVVVPENTAQIARIMTIADRERIPIIPRGAGTNICGGSVAKEGGIVMTFNRMNRILEIDPANRCAVVQPGVVNAEFQRAVAEYGLLYPPDPASLFVSTIGGNVALNAGGPRGVKYGVTRDYLLGLEVVLPSGEIIRTGGKTMKNVTGYDLTRLFCGSEGTLGIVTEIIARLVPLPPAKATLQAVFADLDDATRTVSAIIGSGIVPTTLELIDRVVLEIIANYGGARFAENAEALLLIEVDGERQLVDAQGQRIEQFCRQRGAVHVERAGGGEEADRLWQARRTAFGAVAQQRPNCIVEDATVPVERLPEIIRRIVDIGRRYDLKIGVLAHAGDGNLHPLIMTDQRDKQEMQRVDRAIDDMYEAAIAVGGTLSGEHGIGVAKSRYLEKEFNPAALAVMRGIKQVFDPHNILNPGSFI